MANAFIQYSRAVKALGIDTMIDRKLNKDRHDE